MIVFCEWLSKIAGWLFVFVGLIAFESGSIMQKTLNFVHLGGIYTFIQLNVYYILPVLAVLFLLRWLRDWRFLLGIGVAFFIFIKFVV